MTTLIIEQLQDNNRTMNKTEDIKTKEKQGKGWKNETIDNEQRKQQKK